MPPKKFKIHVGNGGEACVERTQSSDTHNSQNVLKGKVERVGSSIIFIPNNIDQSFDEFFEKFVDKVTAMCLINKNTDLIFGLCKELIVENTSMCKRFFEKESKCEAKSVEEVLSKTKDYTLKKISAVKTDYLREKRLKKNKYYVAPIEKAIGLKWKTKIMAELDLADHFLVQTTFQIVPPSQTLAALFLNDNFKTMFLEYNEQKRLNGCAEGVYEDYCCGNVAKNSEILQSNDKIVLQFGIDEFDCCCGLKTKATVHKILAVYFHIRNIPTKYHSQLNNIFLVALCPSINFKETGCCDDDVVEEIVRDLKKLEKEGLDIGNGKRLKVGLFNICCDNLGANVLFGFSGGFNTDKFCRFCICSKNQTQSMATENASKIRTIASYDSQIQRLKLNPDLELKETEGIKKNCLFNELSSFHVCANLSADIMHDILEGAVPYFLRSFLKYCIDKKICNSSDLVRRVRDFNYGTQNSKNKPSQLKIDRKNLGQNASQSYCIMTHLPFMFIDKKHELRRVWLIMVSLLELMTIVFSYKIRESDIHRMNHCVREHLNGMIREFKIDLKPKHHNLTHYAKIIREMGPLRYSWMMRMESKHKFFTDVARKTNNFVNIALTLAETHQAYISTHFHSFEDHIQPSNKKYLVKKDFEYKSYRQFLESISIIDIDASVILRFLKYNGRMYRKGYLVLYEQIFYEIVYVLSSQNEFFLICQKYEFVQFDRSLNSLEICKADHEMGNLKCINVKDLSINETYEKKIAKGSVFVINEHLEILNSVS